MTVISLSKIRRDGGTQFRAALDPAVIAEYAEAMTRGEVFPAVVVFHDGTDHWLADGFYRCAATAQAHLDEVTADVRPGTQREARLYAATEANRTHGVRMSNEEKRARVLAVLQDEEGRRWSDREIARRCGVGHPLVAEMRRQLEDLPVDEPRQGADGKVRKLPRKPEATPPLDDVGASNNAAPQHDEEPSTAPTAGRTYHSLLDNAALEGKPIVHRDPKPDTEEDADADLPDVSPDPARTPEPQVAGGPAPPPVLRPEVQEQDEESPEACGYRPSAALAPVALALKLGEGATLAQIEARIGELLATEDAIAKRGYIQGELEALEYVAEHVLVMSPGTWLGATAPELRTEIEEAVEVLEEKASRLGEAERQAFQEGEREALMAVGAYLGCEGDMEEIAAAIEALKDAAPGPGPGEGEAELQRELEQARAEIKSLEGRLAQTGAAMRASSQELWEVRAALGELGPAKPAEAVAEMRTKFASLQEHLGAARAEASHLQKEVAALKGQLATPRPAAPPEVREGYRIGDQVSFRRGKKRARALVAAFTGQRSAHLWIRPDPQAKSAEARKGYWELASLAELAVDPQQDPEAEVLAACLAAPPALDWIPALRARLAASQAAPQEPPAVHKERCSAPGCARPAVWHGFLAGLGAEGGLCSAHGGLSRGEVRADLPRLEQQDASWRPATCGRAKMIHAAGPDSHDRARCSFRPPHSSKGWQDQPGAAITCPGCVGEGLAEQAGAAP